MSGTYDRYSTAATVNVDVIVEVVVVGDLNVVGDGDVIEKS